MPASNYIVIKELVEERRKSEHNSFQPNLKGGGANYSIEMWRVSCFKRGRDASRKWDGRRSGRSMFSFKGC